MTKPEPAATAEEKATWRCLAQGKVQTWSEADKATVTATQVLMAGQAAAAMSQGSQSRAWADATGG